MLAYYLQSTVHQSLSDIIKKGKESFTNLFLIPFVNNTLRNVSAWVAAGAPFCCKSVAQVLDKV
jgi:hypothetical protein